MPFTFSHPALILPFIYLPKKWFSLTGLIIGSLTPDFEYFLRMKLKSDYSHTLGGIFWFNLPLGIIIAFLFHNLIRNNLINNSPIFFSSRLLDYKNFNWNNYFVRNYIIVLFSIIIGTITHIIIDNFTHEHGVFVQNIKALLNTVNFWIFQIPIFKIIQHLTTLLGGILLFYMFYKLPTNKTIKSKINLKYWIVTASISFLIFTIRLLSGLDIKQYGNVLVTAISAFIISLIFSNLIFKTSKIKN